MAAPASAETLTDTLAPEDVTVDVRTPDGATKGTVELPGGIFDVQVNIPLIHQVVVAQLAAARQGTHSTKTRGEVQGGGRKPYSRRAPAAPARARPAPRSSPAAASSTARSRGTTRSGPPRR